MPQPYLNHLETAESLKTSYADTRAGFVSLALEKNRRATPYVEEARTLQALALKAKSAPALINLKEIRLGLLTAAGVSEKAAKHLDEADMDEAISGLIANFLEPAGDKFVEELVFRFLLTKGDALGGSMRNVAGVLAVRKFTRFLISALRLSGTKYWWRHSQNKTWALEPDDDADIELFLNGLSWESKLGKRTLLYNFTVPIVGNNIDLCLLNGEYAVMSRTIHSDKKSYLVLGELKGGIDPAGADEHWKTARTALARIHEKFKGTKAATFFVGAAIEDKMATEIWNLLRAGTIDNAANLNSEKQMASLSQWICNL